MLLYHIATALMAVLTIVYLVVGEFSIVGTIESRRRRKFLPLSNEPLPTVDEDKELLKGYPVNEPVPTTCGNVIVRSTSTGEGEERSHIRNLSIMIGETEKLDLEQFPCTHIEGDLTITDTAFEDLRYFNFVEDITGTLVIDSNPQLIKMEKTNTFPKLQWVDGGVSITSNDALSVILNVFNSITSTATVLIYGNGLLFSISKIFNGLTSVGENGIRIGSNGNLTVIDEVFGMLKGSSEGGVIRINENSRLQSVTKSFSKLKFGSIEVLGNLKLERIEMCFNQLTTIKKKRSKILEEELGFLIIKGNPLLSSMKDSFGKVKWVIGNANVSENGIDLRVCSVFKNLLSAFTRDPDPQSLYAPDKRTYNFPDTEYDPYSDPSKTNYLFYESKQDHKNHDTTFLMDDGAGKMESVEEFKQECGKQKAAAEVNRKAAEVNRKAAEVKAAAEVNRNAMSYLRTWPMNVGMKPG